MDGFSVFVLFAYGIYFFPLDTLRKALKVASIYIPLDIFKVSWRSSEVLKCTVMLFCIKMHCNAIFSQKIADYTLNNI